MKAISKSISKTLGVALPLITILAVVTPIVMIESLFFPFITGKAFYFRILVEIMALLYILYVAVDKTVRPRFTAVSVCVSVFTVILGLATLFAEDPLKSFWSNYERMEGFILFIHLFAYFIIAGSVMKIKEGWWRWFFVSSLAMSIIVGADAFISFYSDKNSSGYRIFGNLGNSSYLGMYSLAHVFIALFMIIQKVAKKTVSAISKEGSWVSIGFFSLAMIFNLVVMFNTGTRGSFVGLVLGVFVASLIIALFEKNNKVLRTIGISLIATSLLFVLALGLGKNTSVVKNSDMLTRFAELVTLDVKGVISNQGKARSLLWGIAWEGTKDRPVLGWGLDNFHYVFAKHYTPEMANQEQWFDRSHNVFTDWLTQAGFLGLISYFSLFGAALYILWPRRKNIAATNNSNSVGSPMSGVSGLSISERAIIIGGLVAYLGHNLFVFDNLSSYVIFFSLLAYLHQLSVAKKVEEENKEDIYLVKSATTLSIISSVALISFIFVIYFVNIKPIYANLSLIDSLRPQIQDPKTSQVITVPPKIKFEHLQKSIAYKSMSNSEQNEQLADRGSEYWSTLSSTEERDLVNKYVVENYEAAIARTPNDPRIFFFYALYLSKTNDNEGAYRISKEMLKLSPEKPSFLVFTAINALKMGKLEEFRELAAKAHELNPQDEQAHSLYIMGLIQVGNFAEAEATAKTVPEMSVYLTNYSIVDAYINANMANRVIDLIKKQIVADPFTLDLRSTLASVYVRVGNYQAGIRELEEIKKLAPQYSQNIDQAIEQIKAEAKMKK